MNNKPQASSSSSDRRKQFLKNIKLAVSQVNLTQEQERKLKEDTETYQNFTYQPLEKNVEEKLLQFKEILTTQSAEIYECSETKIIEKLEEILKEKSYGTDVLIGKNAKLNQLKTHSKNQVNFIEVESFEKNNENYNLSCALTTAFAAASETGTLFLSSGSANPTWLNYLATCHIVLLDKNTLCQTYEQAFALSEGRSRGEASTSQQAFPPRSINMISGPSRTADIEQTLTLGAHGPIELIIIIYTSESTV